MTESTYTGGLIDYDNDITPNGQHVTVPGKLRHGHGEITYSSGSHFEGQWVNDVREGKGVFTFACGDVYEGEWKNGMYHGYGKYIGFNSDSYEGEWKEDKMHGQGSYTYRDSGDVYEGRWFEGKREGRGKEVCGNGDVYEGEYRNDERVSLSLLNREHLLSGTDENGVRIRIFTARLTGTREAIVARDTHRASRSAHTRATRFLTRPTAKGLRCPASCGMGMARSRMPRAHILWANGSTTRGRGWARTRMPAATSTRVSG